VSDIFAYHRLIVGLLQTINCLELWAKLLAAKADEAELRPLIYPVTQARAPNAAIQLAVLHSL
jgi:hypothetical protein